MPLWDRAVMHVLIRTAGLELRNRTSRRSVLGPGTGPVVSLTSYGPRVARVHVAVESIAAGAMRPSRLILWLEAGAMADLPRALLRLRRRGLEIRETPDWGPHKKYYPYCEERTDDERRTLVTADDDVLYPRSWLQHLARAVASAPDRVWCYRSWVLTTSSGVIAPYLGWPANTSRRAASTNFATGVSGVAYPPELQSALRDSGRSFMTDCFHTDDIWLHVHALRSGIPVSQVTDDATEFPSLRRSQETALAVRNQGGGNDLAIALTYTAADVALLEGAPELTSGGRPEVSPGTA